MKTILVALLLLWNLAYAEPSELNATAALVMDAETNDVLFQKNHMEIRSIASITKMMTALVTIEEQLPLDEHITITNEDVNATRLRNSYTGGSLGVGTTLTRGELLQLALMNSQNRAAAALGRTFPGGIDVFVQKMNTKARELGMLDTTFVDPTGLFSANRSTAYDLAILIKAASDYKIIRDFSTATSFQITTDYHKHHRFIGFGTTNKLVSVNRWNVLIQKTGYIQDAGHCLVMMTTIAARNVIIVLLNTPDNHKRALDAITLMYWLEHNISPSTMSLSALDPYPTRTHSRRFRHR
jgi:D-alanyl-D-alanine endopeptidase (penicillin-binding protein 7)